MRVLNLAKDSNLFLEHFLIAVLERLLRNNFQRSFLPRCLFRHRLDYGKGSLAQDMVLYSVLLRELRGQHWRAIGLKLRR